MAAIGRSVVNFAVLKRQLGWKSNAGALGYVTSVKGGFSLPLLDLLREDMGDEEARGRLDRLVDIWAPIVAEEQSHWLDDVLP
jgi:hypothetical protein